MKGYSKELKYTVENNFSEELVNGLAKKTGFVKRAGKLSASSFVNTLMFSSCNQAKTSLPDLTADLSQQFAVDMSKEALHKRFGPQAVDFLKELVREQLSREVRSPLTQELKSHFTAIYSRDSCKFSLPETYGGQYPGFGNFSKTNGLMNMQFEYDLVNEDLVSFELTKSTRNDQQDSKEGIGLISEGALYIRDLGYITPTYLKAITGKGAYFLNRAPSKANIYMPENKLLDWKKIHRKLQRTVAGVLDMDVMLYEKERLPCRLIIEPVVDDEYEKRINNAKKRAKSQGVGVSDIHKIKCRYNIFVTNVDRDTLPAEKIRKTYYLRWQIELVFKTWKSFFEIDKVKKVKKERLECQLLAKFLWILLNWRLFQACNKHVRKKEPSAGVSILKFFKRCLSFSDSLRLVVLQRTPVSTWLRKIFLPLIENTACEAPRKKVTHYQVFKENLTSLS